MSGAREAFASATRARLQEIAADQAEARTLIETAINGLRDKGYPPMFVRSTLAGYIHYSPAATQRVWPPHQPAKPAEPERAS